jgi:hypothetical protein
MAALDTFIALRNYVKGKISDYELEESDDLISSVRERQNKGQSEVRVEYNSSEDFLKKIGINDDDIWFYRAINSSYSDYEFMDWYSAKDDFENGYGVYYVLDDDNIEKLSKISKMILPMKVDFDDENFKTKLSEKLLTNFKSETEDIISDYQYRRNDDALENARRIVEKELNEFIKELGFEIYGDGFKTTVGNLVMLYLKENKIHLTLEELLGSIVETANPPSGWAEDPYHFFDYENFDKDMFNNYTSGKLDDILEKLSDMADSDGFSVKDFTVMIDRITKRFKIGRYYNLPKDTKKDVRFKIEGFEFPKVVITLQKGLKQKKLSLTEDNFYNLLYQPTLFNLEEI